MPAINTSNWVVNDDLDTMTTTDVQSWAQNIPTAYTLNSNEGSAGNFTSSFGYNAWNFGIPPFAGTAVSTQSGTATSDEAIGIGRSVRPPQRFLWLNPAESGAVVGQHMNYYPVIRGVRIYTNSFGVPTGVIGVLVTTFAVSAWSNFAFPNFNDASPELDLLVYFQNDTDQYLEIRNFPVNTFGFGNTIVIPQGDSNRVIYYRTTLDNQGTGVARVRFADSVHNVSSSQYSIHGDVSTIGAFQSEIVNNAGNNLIIAYRWHSQVAPFTNQAPVARVQEILNVGSQYQPAESYEFYAPMSSTNTNAGSPNGMSQVGDGIFTTMLADAHAIQHGITGEQLTADGIFNATVTPFTPSAGEFGISEVGDGIFNAGFSNSGATEDVEFDSDGLFLYAIQRDQESQSIGGDRRGVIPVLLE